uniref:Uncharacterized protein n=1 Tax=Candidatus Kentrum sp. LFY TaxID=2126342 RepID=A0A450UY41_9GAMM|nr:MAG: hypothetical protein BECKLFY1418B_GA0070995_11013 [Candidatus Kentron sp. LFY]
MAHVSWEIFYKIKGVKYRLNFSNSYGFQFFSKCCSQENINRNHQKYEYRKEKMVRPRKK